MRPLKRPMFKYGGDVKRQGIMHGMNGLRDGGVATTMADATGYAGGGMTMPDMRGRVTGPGGYAGKVPGMLPINQQPTPRTRLNIGVPNQPATKVQNFYNKGLEKAGKVKGFLKKPVFSERGIKTLIKRKAPQYAKGIARSIGNFAGGVGSRLPFSSLVGKRALPYYAMYKASEVTPVDEKYNISRYRDNLFAPLQTGDTSRDIMQKKALRNAEQAANPNNFYRYDSGKYGPRKDHPNYDPKKIRYNPFSKDTGAADTEIPRDAEGNIIRFNDAESMFGLKKLKATPGYSKEDRETKLPGEGDLSNVPDAVKNPPKTQAEIDAEIKANEDKKLKRIYSLLGVDRAKRGAASKALADMSRYIDEGGKDTISKKNLGSTLTKGILAFDKRLDKVDQLKEAAGLMLAKGEIAEMGDPLGKEAKRLSIKVNKEKLNPGVETMLMAAEQNAKGGTVSEAKISEAVRRGALNEGKELIEYISSDDIDDGNLSGSVTEIVGKLENIKPGYYQVGKSVVEVGDDRSLTLRSGPALQFNRGKHGANSSRINW